MGRIARAIAAPIRLFQSITDEVAKEIRLSLKNGAGWAAFFGRDSYSGKVVSIDTALQLATVWACIKLSAQAVSSLPGAIYERQSDDSRERVRDDSIGEVIFDTPNADQTSVEFWEETVAWLMTTGNACAEKVTAGRRLLALEPLNRLGCRPVRKADDTLVYQVNDRGRTEELPRDKVFHVKGFGQGLRNRDLGLSPIAYGAHSLGSAMAADEASGRLFGQGMQASGVLSSEQVLKERQRDQLQKIMEAYAGSKNAGKLMILEAGLKYEQLILDPDDAQMLETRKFSIEEICRWFGVPPIVIGHAAQGQTMWGSGVEAILIAWLTLGIDPICDRIEARINKQLIRQLTGNRRRYAEFNREALLQMDSAAKARFLSTMVQNGLMDRNEGRAKLNLPSRDGAGALTAQTNLAPLDRLGAADGATAARSAFLNWLGIQPGDDHDEA